MTAATLRLSDLDPPIALLRMIDKGCLEYLELTDSIADNGVLNSILVRPSPADSSRFQIVDSNLIKTGSSLRPLTRQTILTPSFDSQKSLEE